MKSYKQFLIELTKGEKLGYKTKISINEYVKEHLDITQDNIPGTDVKNSFTSFRDINKLGINPKSKFKTPNGIYCYPNQYVRAVIGDSKPATALPFAGDNEYAYLFPVKASKEKQIIHLQTITESEEQELYKKIKTLLETKYPKLKIHEQLDDIIKKSKDKNGARYKTIPAGRFWYVTRNVADLINKEIGGTHRTHPVQWSKLFMDIGIYGFIDMDIDNLTELADIYKRYGIIHTSEPTQAVFFDTSVVDKSDNKKYKSVYNKHSEGYVLAQKSKGEHIAKDKAKLRSITNYDELKKEIDRNPKSIENIKIYNIDKFKEFMKTKPSNESAKKYKTELETDLQLTAVKSEVFAINYIEHPTYEVEKFIIDRASYMIDTIKNMSTEAQIYAIEKEFTNITKFSKITDGTINYILNNYVNDKNKKQISNMLNYHYIDKTGRKKLILKFDAKFRKDDK